MSLTGDQKNRIEAAIRGGLRQKSQNYDPETKLKPFHYRLLGRDRMAFYSFIHYLNPNLNTSIFEPLIVILAGSSFESAQKQYVIGNTISEAAQAEIEDIIKDIKSGGEPDKPKEVERIRKVCRRGKMNKLTPVKVDLLIRGNDGAVYLFDLKTAKPNIDYIVNFKRTLLEWIAIFLTEDPSAKVNSYIANPYNPFEPKPYKTWPISNMLDLKNELKVAEEFWNFLSGGDVYPELLDCFEKVGIELKPEIDAYFPTSISNDHSA